MTKDYASIRHAVVLAGGSGTRLMPLTADRPKALVEVDGVPLIERQIKWLKSNGIQEIHLSCSEKWLDTFRERLGNSVKYYPEPEPRDTGGGLKIVLDETKLKERFLLCNVDDLNDIDLQTMGKIPENVMALHKFRCPFGVPKTNTEFIIDFLQKPETDFWINEGIYILEPYIAGMLTEKCNLERDVFPILAAAHKLRFYKHEGFWHTVNTVKDVTEFRKILENKD